MFLTQNNPLSCNCSNHMYWLYIFICTKVQICMTECILIKGFKLSLSCSACLSESDAGVWIWLLEHTYIYKLWQLPGQGEWHRTRSVVVHCQFLATLLVFCCWFACRTDHILQLSIINVMKDNTQNDFWQKSVSTNETDRPRPNQAPEKNTDCQAQGYWK